jgi:hypothetical protein
LIQATTKHVPCQVRSKTQSPCLHRAVAEIQGIPFCEACAREQEMYFAIGELTQRETQGLRSEPLSKPHGKTLGETLEGIRRQRTDDLAAARRLDFPSVDETERLALTEIKQS